MTASNTAGRSLTAGSLAALLGILGWIYFFSGIGEQIESRCHVNGMGQGSCSFTNTGWTPGHQCVEVRLTNKQGGSASSGSICSGNVWPNDTVARDVAIVAPAELCGGGLFSSWSDNCSMQVVGIPHAEAPEEAASESTRGAGQETSPSPGETTPSGPVGVSTPSTAQSQSTPEPAEQGGPSFDCAKAHSPAERLICSDAELAALDVELAALYAQAKAAAPDQAAFAQESRSEWSQRESTCTDKQCLIEWYAHRRAQLSAYTPEARAVILPQDTATGADASAKALYGVFTSTITTAGFPCETITTARRSASYEGWRVTCGSHNYALVDVGGGHWMAERD